MGSSGLLAVLRRATPASGAVGGLCFFGYWFVHAREIALPSPVGALLDVATFVFLGTAVLGYQLAQGLAPGAWLGWAGVTALLQGLLQSHTAVCCGLVLLGASLARSGVQRRVPGVIMASSGFALLLTLYYSSGFGRGHAEMGLVGKAAMGAALVGVAASMADLLLLEHGPQGPVGEAHGVGGA